MAICSKCNKEMQLGDMYCSNCGQSLYDSMAGNKKSRYGIDTLMGAGISQKQAVALMAYHGSLMNIRAIKDVKGLLKYKYLKDIMSEKEAKKVIDYLMGNPVKNIAGVSDNLKENKMKKQKYVCEKCQGEVNDDVTFCPHCGAQFDSLAISKEIQDAIDIMNFNEISGIDKVDPDLTRSLMRGNIKIGVEKALKALNTVVNFKDKNKGANYLLASLILSLK